MKIKFIPVLLSVSLLTNSALAATKISSMHDATKKSPAPAGISAPSGALAVNKNSSYYHAPFVFASPYLSGAKSAYNASDLITNWSSINEDLAILQAQKKHANALEAAGMAYPDRPIIAISGYVEGRVSALHDYDASTKNDINLNAVEVDFLSQMTPWASAYISIVYDKDSQPVGPRYDYSDIYLSRAFLTIGNLDKLPIYGTIGQFFVPFGSYSSNMIGDSVTKLFAKTKARALQLGFYKSNVHAEIYAFKGESYDNGSQQINNGGANLGYKFAVGDKFSASFGAGYLYNIADSAGMQTTGGKDNGSFVGFSGSVAGYYSKSSSENLMHSVPAGDVYAKLTFGQIASGEVNLFAEYISTLGSFNPNDLMFNGKGAKPSALNIEAAYRFDVVNKPAFVSATYGQTKDALALNLPKESYVGTFGISLWKSTVEKLEFRHELNYGYDDYASGGNQSKFIYTTTKRVRNIGMFQIDVYF